MLAPLPSLLWNLFFLLICLDEAVMHWKDKHYVQAVCYGLLVVLWCLVVAGLFGALGKEPVF